MDRGRASEILPIKQGLKQEEIRKKYNLAFVASEILPIKQGLKLTEKVPVFLYRDGVRPQRYFQ